MSPQERVAALEGMLERIQRNAARPRAAAAAVAAPAAAAPAAPAPVRPSTPPDPVFDRTVDELLEAPIPLVQSAAQKRAAIVEPISIQPPPARSQQPPPRDQASLDAEEAAIPLITSFAPDTPAMSGVQPAGAQEEAEDLGEELGEDDLVSIPPPAAAASDVLDFDEEDEEAVPASSQRPRATLAASEPADEREVPLKTPPPESGPQAAMPPQAALEAPRLPEIREAFASGPTPEQLGDTIELPEPSNAALELDVRTHEVVLERPVSEELEVSLPTREAASIYDATLPPPASARDDIRRYDSLAAGQPVESVQPAAQIESVAPTQIVVRRELAGTAVGRFLGKSAEFTPRSFLELLEASLRLGSE